MSVCVVRWPVVTFERRLDGCSSPRRRVSHKRIPQCLNARDPSLENVVPLKRGLDHEGGVIRPLLNELPQLLSVSTPAFFHGVFALSLPSIMFLLIGRLGTMELSIVSLSLSFYYLTGASIIEGLTIAIEILGGQAHGAGNHDLVDLTFRRGWLLSLFTCCCLAWIWSRSEWIFLQFGQDPQISKCAAGVLQWMIPYFFVDATLTCLTKSLASRGIIRPTMIACGLSTVMAPIVLWFFIHKTPLGMYGAPVALFSLAVFAVSMILLLKPRRGWQSDAQLMKRLLSDWTGMQTYFMTTLPCLCTVCCEWWMFEIFGFLAGLVPNPEVNLGIMGATNGVINAVFLAAFSLAGGTIVRVSNNLGAGKKAAAVTSAKTGLLVAVVMESLILVQLCCFAPMLARAWFVDSTAATSLAAILPWVAFTEWGSGMSYVLGGVLRACNRGMRELTVDFSSYWGVAFPLGTVLAFVCGMSVKGFWVGLATAAMVQFMTLSWMVSKLNVDTEIERARRLVM